MAPRGVYCAICNKNISAGTELKHRLAHAEPQIAGSSASSRAKPVGKPMVVSQPPNAKRQRRSKYRRSPTESASSSDASSSDRDVKRAAAHQGKAAARAQSVSAEFEEEVGLDAEISASEDPLVREDNSGSDIRADLALDQADGFDDAVRRPDAPWAGQGHRHPTVEDYFSDPDADDEDADDGDPADEELSGSENDSEEETDEDEEGLWEELQERLFHEAEAKGS